MYTSQENNNNNNDDDNWCVQNLPLKKKFVKELEDLEIRGQVGTIKTSA